MVIIPLYVKNLTIPMLLTYLLKWLTVIKTDGRITHNNEAPKSFELPVNKTDTYSQ